MKSADMMGGFAKGLEVIQVFDQGHPRLTIAEAAQLAGLDRASTRRCLLTLVNLGFAETDGKYFSLTPRIMRLGRSFLVSNILPRLVQPYLETIARETGESSSVAVLDSVEIVYVARASQRRIISFNLGPGSRLPVYCHSMGRVLLAALPDDEVLRILEATERRAFTHYTKYEIGELMAELARVRLQGYSTTDQELEIGLRSIAVPLVDRFGRTLAAINIGAHVSSVTIDDLVNKHLPKLLHARSELQQML